MCSEHFKPPNVQTTFSGKRVLRKGSAPSVFVDCFGEGIVQRNTEGTEPFLNTRFPERFVRKSDGLKCSKQTFVMFYYYGQ